MDKKVAEVAITANVDQLYDYSIPLPFRKEAEVGKRVKVPFSGGITVGFIANLKEESSYQGELLEVAEIRDPQPVIDENSLTLARWLSDYYLSPLGTVLKRFVPKKVRWTSSGVRKKLVVLTKSLEEILEIIDELSPKAPQQVNLLKALLSMGSPPLEKKLLNKVGCSKSPLRGLMDKGIVEIKERKLDNGLPDVTFKEECKQVQLVRDQRRALKAIETAIQGEGSNFLLWGVNGSGKTQIYMRAVQKAIDQGGQAIISVPQISLTPQLIARLRNRFSNQLAVYHSGLTDREKAIQWRRIKEGRARIAIGVRSVIFTPLPNLKVIVIDEEHEKTYKQSEQAPRYHLRDIALKRAQIEKATVVMGSATPSLGSFWRASKGEFKLLQLPRPVRGRPPHVKIINMNDKSGIFSQSLRDKIKDRLKKGEQVILFLNRRGFSNSVICKDCQESLKCPDCQVSLTYHLDEQVLRCHYCGKAFPATSCFECGSTSFKFWGLGIQQAERRINKLFPTAQVARMDSDKVKRGEHGKILEEFRKGEIDILLGTQMISMGLDFPNVTLAGIISCDTLLYMPDFRSGERTFQLISHTCGRAGRGEKRGEVVIQTHNPHHYSIKYGAKQDYRSFFEEEIKIRKKLGYPPFSHLTKLWVEGKLEHSVKEKASQIGDYLSGQDFQILGPGKSYPYHLRGKFRWQILLKGSDLELMRESVAHVLKKYGRGGIKVDVDPV